MTFIEKFDYLKSKYATKADTSKFKDSFIAAQITMSDEDCKGTMYAAFIDGTFSFEPYDYHDNTVAIIINSLLLEDCIKGKADPVKEYLDGKIQAWGNLDHAIQLIDCLKGKKKAASKKATEKGEATNKEAVAPKKRTCKKKSDDSAKAVKTEEAKAEEVKTETPKKRSCKKKTTEK